MCSVTTLKSACDGTGETLHCLTAELSLHRRREENHAVSLMSDWSNYMRYTYLHGRMKHHIHSSSKILCINVGLPIAITPSKFYPHIKREEEPSSFFPNLGSGSTSHFCSPVLPSHEKQLSICCARAGTNH